jgi:hypothetical protein
VHRSDRNGACDLACGVSAHSIGDDKEGEFLVDEEVVLVVIAHLAHVGCGVEADGVAECHAIRAIVPREAPSGAIIAFDHAPPLRIAVTPVSP